MHYSNLRQAAILCCTCLGIVPQHVELVVRQDVWGLVDVPDGQVDGGHDAVAAVLLVLHGKEPAKVNLFWRRISRTLGRVADGRQKDDQRGQCGGGRPHCHWTHFSHFQRR